MHCHYNTGSVWKEQHSSFNSWQEIVPIIDIPSQLEDVVLHRPTEHVGVWASSTPHAFELLGKCGLFANALLNALHHFLTRERYVKVKTEKRHVTR